MYYIDTTSYGGGSGGVLQNLCTVISGEPSHFTLQLLNYTLRSARTLSVPMLTLASLL